MRSLYTIAMIVVLLVAFSYVSAPAQEKADSKQFKYGGVATCKACHLTKKSGAQYKIWQKSPHSNAFETLKSEQSMAIAKKMGIEDPTASGKCLKCHVTAYGVDDKLKGPKLAMDEGVGCESCHGPGSEYKGRKVMKDIYEGKVDGAKFGLIEPTEEVCVTCHNEESPTFKGFKYAEAVEKISHPVPKE